MVPGASLREARERLGLTYRDVERASYELALKRGRPDFILHLSRLAEIENGGVTPSLYKLYSLCSIYHLDIFEVCDWYEAPLQEMMRSGLGQAAPRTHLVASSCHALPPPPDEPPKDVTQTKFLGRKKGGWGPVEAALFERNPRYCLGVVGTDDHRMDPLLRAGSHVVLDPGRQRVENSGWTNEFDRPIYFIELRVGYRCCWCLRDRHSLILQPHPLSSCPPEITRFPDEAEIVGQVVGVAMPLI